MYIHALMSDLKDRRQRAIADLIRGQQLASQDELAERLSGLGFAVTQATISRDLEQLGAVKVRRDGHLSYALPDQVRDTNGPRLAAVFRDWVAGDSIAIQGVPGGTMGVALPELAEALGNTPVLPIHACGQGYGEQFLQALETAVILARFFGCRALLSRLPVPILDLSTTPEVALCVEGMPRNLGWLLSGTADGAPGASGSLNAAALQGLLERLGHLHALKQRLWFAGFSGDMVHELATAMQDDALGIFAYLERTASPGFKPGRTKHDAVEQYVTLFFDGVLAEAHHGDVNRLLGRTRLVRSAYLFYIRQCIPLKQQEQALREDERVEMLAQPERKL